MLEGVVGARSAVNGGKRRINGDRRSLEAYDVIFVQFGRQSHGTDGYIRAHIWSGTISRKEIC